MGRQANLLGALLLAYAAGVYAAGLDPSGWCLLAAPTALLAALCWKPLRAVFPGPRTKREAMCIGSFAALLCLTMGTQLVGQISGLFLPDRTAVQLHGLSGFLYVCLLAPVGEELLFRLLLPKTLASGGEKLTLFASAALFALLHGSPAQVVYTFFFGLVLAYGALRYGFFWALVLHVWNNLAYGYGLPWLLSGLPRGTGSWAFWGVCVTFFVISAAILGANCVRILDWFRNGPTGKAAAKAFFTAPTIWLFLLLMTARIFFL